MSIKSMVNKALSTRGFEIRRTLESKALVDAIAPDDLETISFVKPYTLTSRERLVAACDAVRYVDRYRIPGAIVECGVWAGGSMMAMARTLMSVGDTKRRLYLFDTFEGMSAPTDDDVDLRGDLAANQLQAVVKEDTNIWAYKPLDQVKQNLARTNYPTELITYVQGKVEDTLPQNAPGQIALLRLDTDWYESTRHELEHLIHRVSPNGILIIDDYGHWQGARKAVDEWLTEYERPVFLSRIDYTGRIAVLP
ncbi:TylF/MycF/NovP-related O-methyltransferase [Mycolicibacterium holsaticum]|uniref:Macrocin O-methyltransferase n=1 Tax=Mycolicibacterium holsaticum TaxID=152142 RepID=A0A1E3R6Y9_9MYCO|nr:TylF/MycF/NovP-related O-methyltransferase [Mycolicibacterium holsaticum]ODQ85708.1 hypothetical protein BHQ17_22310 [Mycolicibacterium holsaticum]